jgi:hypothetical protein
MFGLTNQAALDSSLGLHSGGVAGRQTALMSQGWATKCAGNLV